MKMEVGETNKMYTLSNMIAIALDTSVLKL